MEYEYIRHQDGTSLKAFLVTIENRHLHFHNDVEIIIVLKGSVIIDDINEHHHLLKDHIYITNKNVVHSLKHSNEDNLLMVLQFNPDFCKAYYPQITNIRFAKKHITKENDATYWQLLKNGMESIIEVYDQKKDGYTLAVASLLNQMLLNMLTFDDYIVLNEKKTASESKNIKRLGKIITLIQENYVYNITLKDIASKIGLDMYYLSHFIKEQLGITFQQYVTRLRLEHAEKLLINTNLRNVDICLECGFSDYKYMAKAFMKQFNCTPAEYRKKGKNVSVKLIN